MKKLIALLLLVGLAGGISAAGRIAHPSLLFTPAKIAQAKQRVAADTTYAHAWERIRRQADEQLGRSDVMKLEYLALAWQMTGEAKYADKLRAMLTETAAIPSWSNAEMMERRPAWRSELQMAHRAFQLALAYDAVYAEMTPKERTQIAQGLYRLAVEPLAGDWLLEPTRIHSLNSMGHNWWTSCAGMGGVLALAIANEVPEAAAYAAQLIEVLPEWFDFAGDVVQQKPKTFDAAGGMYESINYASFGITEALLFRLAWLNSHPGARLEAIPQMEQLADFFTHVCYPRTGQLYSINFGDSHKNVTGESAMLLAYEMGAQDPAALWYVNQLEPGQHREGFPRIFPMGFLYTPDLSRAPAEPALPKSKLWSDFGWATLRDAWSKDATMLAVKSGATWNHAHADANSLILFHKGVDILKDAGNCSYGKPEYRNYFFQSEAHNVVLFNGKGQSRQQQYHGAPLRGSLHSLLDGGRTKYVLANGTGPMAQWLARNYRHYLWIGDVILVIDDLKSHEPGYFEWLWHPGGAVTKRGGDLIITEGASSVVVRPLWPEPLAPSDYVHDYPNMLWWEIHEGPTESLDGTEPYWSLHLPQQTDRVKAVTAILLKDVPDQQELPRIERREGKDWIGLRLTQGGKVTDIYINQLADGRLMHLNSWIEADGWTTDAYLFAVTYDTGAAPTAADELFISYGSALRRNDEVWFSSLSKLTLISSFDGRDCAVQVDGQPRLNFRLRTPVRPASLTVNGAIESLRTENGLIRITRRSITR